LAVELHSKEFLSTEDLLKFVQTNLEYLVTARPTAANMSKSAKELLDHLSKLIEKKLSADLIKTRYVDF